MAQVNPFVAGITCRCPRCGEGDMFDGYLKLSARCEACGLDLRAADSGDGPAVFIILIVGMIASFGALFTEFTIHPPIWVNLLIWLPITAILTLALLRPFKGVMIAMQFHNKASQARNDEV
ncbi:MAG: DUF983 domain-containing protein [Caulobacteraceae bacterium]|nr:DUF983 domain-containing protein [Caulobacteraceae bacterium]